MSMRNMSMRRYVLLLVLLVATSGCMWDFQVRDSLNAVQVRRGEVKEGAAAVRALEPIVTTPAPPTSKTETIDYDRLAKATSPSRWTTVAASISILAAIGLAAACLRRKR
jgi:hypothetical protein